MSLQLRHWILHSYPGSQAFHNTPRKRENVGSCLQEFTSYFQSSVFLLCIWVRSSGQPIFLIQQFPNRQSAVQINQEKSYYSRVIIKKRPRKKTCNTSSLLKLLQFWEVFVVGVFLSIVQIRIIVLILAKLMEFFVFPPQSSVQI